MTKNWLTDDNIKYIVENHKGIKKVLKKRNRGNTKNWKVRSDIANTYQSLKTAQKGESASKEEKNNLTDWIQGLEMDKHNWTIFPVRVSDNHWGIFVLENKESTYKFHYTSSLSPESEVEEISNLVNKICGSNEQINVVNPIDKQRNSDDCGVYLIFYVFEILKAGKLELSKRYSEKEIENFRYKWKKEIGEENWCRQNDKYKGDVKEVRQEKEQSKDNSYTRNILLIGRTGNGKSTIANILVNQGEDFEEFFKEGHNSSISETRKMSDKEFKVNETVYRIIDTLGIGDTKLSESEVLHEIARVYDKIGNGLSQVLFVVGKKFTEEEKEAYNVLRTVIFDSEVTGYTTIVKTNFPGFRNSKVCEEDIENIRKENSGLAEIVDSCRKIIYVDNPPINSSYYGEDEIINNKKKRKASRENLVALLGTCNIVYEPKGLYKKINRRINDYVMKEDSRLQEDLEIIKRKLERLEKGETLVGETSEVLKKQMEMIEKLIEENRKLMEKGFFEAVGKGVDKLVDSSLKAVIEVGQLVNKCQIS